MNWQRRYRDLPAVVRLKPFAEFVNFLKVERSVVARLAEVIPPVKKPFRKPQNTETHGTQAEKKVINRFSLANFSQSSQRNNINNIFFKIYQHNLHYKFAEQKK